MPPRDASRFYDIRTGFLKFRSVLCDRNTGLVSWALMVDDVRRFFEEQPRIAVIGLRLGGLERLEFMLGWQACDRLLEATAARLETVLSSRYSATTLLAQDGIHQGRFVLFLPALPDGGRLDGLAALAEARSLAAELAPALAATDGWGREVKIHAAAVLLTDNPIIRFERLLAESVRQVLGEGAAPRRDPQVDARLRKLLAEGGPPVAALPMISLDDRNVMGHEMRPDEPVEGLADMMPDALAAQLDAACVQAALRSAASLKPEQPVLVPTRLASPLTVQWPELLLESGRKPESVVLTVPELVLQEVGPHRQMASELRALGLGLAVDRAGTGHATLELIDDLKPDYVKLDAAITGGIHDHPARQDVARTMVKVATRVGCRVVADGLQDEKDVLAAGACGVPLGLGPGLDRARPPGSRRARAPARRRPTQRT